MTMYKKTIEIDGNTITIETGKVAKQASGSVWVRCGGTELLVTAVGAKEPKVGINFLPLTVDYQEKTHAAGRIPGSYFRREGKPRESETLNSRIIDRSLRPLFEDGWGNETQVIATVMSADPEHPADALALTGASAALEISDLPFKGPIAGVRVCRIDGKLRINPSFDDLAKSDISMFIACSKDAIVMVEGGGNEMSEKDAIDALLFAFEQCQPLIKAQEELRAECGKTKRVVVPPQKDEALVSKVKDVAASKIAEAYKIADKIERYAALDQAKAEIRQSLAEADESLAERAGEIGDIISDIKYNYVRTMVVKDKVRIDGRGHADIRPIDCEVSFLNRTHGSALFTRGETQSVVTLTLGTKQDEQRVDELHGDVFSNFMLHYNFPPYSVGEARFLRGPGRRELGHGALAKRALEPIWNAVEDCPYTIRIVSDITESNGSSSMASVCGGSLAMFDAGLPVKEACAGIAMGLIKEGDDIAILSDILGDEDHLGDMDFKVAGTRNGITAIQMDIKIDGVSRQILETALEQARVGRLHIIAEMDKALAKPRENMSDFAPRITNIKIKEDKIREVIGPGGKVIRDIVARTGAKVDIDDSGMVTIASAEAEGARMAIKMIEDITQEAEMGKLYLGNVRKITDFGAFVQIFPGTDGLVHISELAEKRVNRVEDVLQEGDEVLVKVIGFDRGKIRLSRKAAIIDEREKQKAEADK